MDLAQTAAIPINCGTTTRLRQTRVWQRPLEPSRTGLSARSRCGSSKRSPGEWEECWLSATVVWYCMVLYGVLCGVVWCGVAWCGVVWFGVVWFGVVWCVVWYGVVGYGLVWYSVVW